MNACIKAGIFRYVPNSKKNIIVQKVENNEINVYSVDISAYAMALSKDIKRQAHIIKALKHRGIEFNPSTKFSKDICSNKEYLDKIDNYLKNQSNNPNAKGVSYFKIYKKGKTEIE